MSPRITTCGPIRVSTAWPSREEAWLLEHHQVPLRGVDINVHGERLVDVRALPLRSDTRTRCGVKPAGSTMLPSSRWK